MCWNVLHSWKVLCSTFSAQIEKSNTRTDGFLIRIFNLMDILRQELHQDKTKAKTRVLDSRREVQTKNTNVTNVIKNFQSQQAGQKWKLKILMSSLSSDIFYLLRLSFPSGCFVEIVVYVKCYLSSGACDQDACPALLRSTGTAGLAAFPDCCMCRGSADLEISFHKFVHL